MKRILIMICLVAALLLSACTNNKMARQYGGKETVALPKGERLVVATWKETSLWYLTEPAPDGYQPQVKIFREKSSLGIWEGTVVFVESK